MRKQMQEIIQGVGHNIHVENPVMFTGIVNTFFKNIIGYLNYG